MTGEEPSNTSIDPGQPVRLSWQEPASQGRPPVAKIGEAGTCLHKGSIFLYSLIQSEPDSMLLIKYMLLII
jgi:hypothetical protein